MECSLPVVRVRMHSLPWCYQAAACLPTRRASRRPVLASSSSLTGVYASSGICPRMTVDSHPRASMSAPPCCVLPGMEVKQPLRRSIRTPAVILYDPVESGRIRPVSDQL